MGYDMRQQDVSFFIAAKDVEPAYIAIKEKLSHNIKELIGEEEFDECESLADLFDQLCWEFNIDEQNDIVSAIFEGEKMHDEEQWFEAIAPYVKDGSYIEMIGEDGERWKWIFKDGKCTEQYARIVWKTPGQEELETVRTYIVKKQATCQKRVDTNSGPHKLDQNDISYIQGKIIGFYESRKIIDRVIKDTPGK